jgi:hypothetical protein
MIDFNNLFDPVIEANSNPFQIISKQVYKQNGEIKINNLSESIDLTPINSIIEDIIQNCEIEVIDFYPKGILQKIFKKRNLNNLKEINSNLILISQNTKSKLSKYSVVIEDHYEIDIEDILIIGDRGRLVRRKTEIGIEVNYDRSLFKVFKLI